MYFASKVVQKWPTERVRDMRGMRGMSDEKECVICVICVVRSESRQEVVRDNLPSEPFWEPASSCIIRARGRQMVCNRTKLLVSTPIYMRIRVSFAVGGRVFFPQLLQPLQGRILHEMHRAYMVQHAVKTGLVHLLGREKSPGAKAQMFVGL